ncbi:HAMP domain-containing sensor histidine kinase [Paenibacillus sp. MSJ-34]|uniref:sensor histidine kinase n=1 Tax=Paenibacillus sp. MSJ-34 TaxID=2841529 RepID=UPI001C0FD11C|nr:sensor histidine kinase [Paenibacillus sp. MSJ-34]MBU5445330.1 sensor histidine kinase [Paenibacillus sp. MSJ-34]
MDEWRAPRIGTFLKDRLIYIVIFYIAILLVLLVVWLDLLGLGKVTAISGNSTIYLIVLATAVLAAGLAFDYMRQRMYYISLRRFEDHKLGLYTFVGMHPGVTDEQKFMHSVMEKQFRTYSDQLTAYQLQQEQHHHFTNQWVHHMKTPVSVIDLLNQQAKDLRGVDEARELLNSIQEENERLAQGLEMMLHTARLDKFEFDLHVRKTDLLKVARQVVNQHKKACIRWSIFPKIQCDEPDMIAETDEKWISFVVNQLVTNAIKYSKEKPGDKSLTITLQRDPLDKKVRLSVADEGIGIAEHDLPRVFDPFFTGENGRITAESTGMGLFLSKQVVSRLGHRIEIESAYKKGTVVHIMFHTDTLFAVSGR